MDCWVHDENMVIFSIHDLLVVNKKQYRLEVLRVGDCWYHARHSSPDSCQKFKEWATESQATIKVTKSERDVFLAMRGWSMYE